VAVLADMDRTVLMAGLAVVDLDLAKTGPAAVLLKVLNLTVVQDTEILEVQVDGLRV
jgi:hypothetical protein